MFGSHNGSLTPSMHDRLKRSGIANQWNVGLNILFHQHLIMLSSVVHVLFSLLVCAN